jgi:hypothetical protein
MQEAVKMVDKPKHISYWIYKESVIHADGQMQEKSFTFSGNLTWPKRGTKNLCTVKF